ncbi:MAG: CocE/NonD family hydrolase [Planctomycetota bacterium]|nr:CocE/NonD family hydrolase [Planctomycetota bacterium]
MSQPVPAAEPQLLEVPVSDGSMISVLRYPAARSPAPAILSMTPYRKERNRETGHWVNAAGYDYFLADVRGFGGSNASYHGLLSGREIQDGAELVEWIGRQPFCTGQVGLMGGSYCGANQLLVAAKRPRALRFITPSVAFMDTYRDCYRRGGIRSHIGWGAATFLNSQHRETERRGLSEYYLEIMDDPLDNPKHRARSPEYVLSNIEVPVMCMGGWHDYFLRSTVRAFRLLQGPKRLVIGAWGHSDHPGNHADQLPWFAHWFDKKGADPTAGNRVRLFLTGAEEWRDFEDWFDTRRIPWRAWRPLARERDARVVTDLRVVPGAPNPKKQFAYDAGSGMGQWGEDTTFDGEPFAEDVDLGGSVGLEAELTVFGCEDVELHARLSVVRADGTVQQLTEGRLRAAHRAVDLERSERGAGGQCIVPWHPHDRYEALADGQRVTLNVEINPLYHRVFRGERLRLGLTLARADEGAVPARARLGPGTTVWLPWPA